MEETAVLTFNNPATGVQFGAIPMSTEVEIGEAMRAMRSADNIWRDTSVRQRVKILRKFKEVLIDSLDEISEVLNQDCGKSRQDALIEVFMTVDFLQVYLRHAESWLKRRSVSTGLYVFKRAFVEPRPYGVVLVIGPWNYPFALTLPPVFAALLAGNTVLLKPSEVTGATGVLIERLIQRVPELSPFVRVMHGDGRVGAALVEAAPDYIFLTGSTATGRIVMQNAAKNLIPVACELGGKDAMIVLEDADLEAAALWGVWGAFFNTGQTCMSVERVYVVEPLYDAFVSQCVEQAKQLGVGYSKEINNLNFLGPMTDPRQVKIVQRHLKDAQAKGAQIIFGGNQDGMFIEPTILANVDHSMLLMQEETFGPLMPIMKVKDEAEAIRMANDCNFGLGASVWSNNNSRAIDVARRVEAASIIINDTIAQFAVPMLPFGGLKESGYGRTHGKEGLLQFTQPYSYAYGPPPLPFDVATIARKPGNYTLMSHIIHVAFGSSRQKIEPLGEILQESGIPQRLQRNAPSMAAILGLASAAAGALVLARKLRGKS